MELERALDQKIAALQEAQRLAEEKAEAQRQAAEKAMAEKTAAQEEA